MTTTKTCRWMLAAAAIVAASAGNSEPAAAGKHRAYKSASDSVIAMSRFGHGHVVGAVRGTSVGPQVQLPSGSWVYCRRSCSETLRVETVDVNESLRDGNTLTGGQLANECGIFGCLDIGF